MLYISALQLLQITFHITMTQDDEQMPMQLSDFDGDASITVCISQLLNILLLLLLASWHLTPKHTTACRQNLNSAGSDNPLL